MELKPAEIVIYNSFKMLKIDREHITIISSQQAWHYRILPKSSENGKKVFYCSNLSANTQEELELVFGEEVELVEAEDKELDKGLLIHYPTQTKKSVQINLIDQAISNYLPLLLEEAHTLKSSDIHIEVYEEDCRIRFRVDGKLTERYQLGKDRYPALVNRLKIQAHLDIAEKRRPQDGRIVYKDEHVETDIRVSIMPTLYGEKVVLRLLNKEIGNVSLDHLGFSTAQLNEYLKAIQKPHGIVLISGPTGSGKTTTLYASLKLLNKENVNILTIEDPVEYTLKGINQVQVKEDIGLTFAAALRTFLRQDPDIIMLGEIRDKESAQMAIRASLTGHLVFSTIHTNSAYGTISRLLDMDIPAYLLANTLNISMAQRLLRVLCPKCKKEEEFSSYLLPAGIKLPKVILKHYTPQGCEYCYFTGYSGRKAIYEIIPVSGEIAEQIRNDRFKNDSLNYTKLNESALELFYEGHTSFNEILSYLI